MSLICWNCRGLGNPLTIHFLKDLIIQKRPKFLFLCETFCLQERIDFVRRLLGFEACFAVNARGHKGGIVMFWKCKEEGRVLRHSFSHIDMEVRLENHPIFKLTGFYGKPNR